LIKSNHRNKSERNAFIKVLCLERSERNGYKNEKNYLLGIDIGTTSTITILIDENGNLLASSTSDYELITLKPGWVEQNPDDWWTATVKTIKDVIEKTNISPRDIACIGLSGQMHGSVFLDNKGKIIRPAILWCDQRTYSQCEKIYKIFGQDSFIKLSYNKALLGFTAPMASHLKLLKKQTLKLFFYGLEVNWSTARTCPMRNRRKEISKGDGKVRVLGIPSIRDRVVQGALKLIAEPIFEADFQEGSYGYRPKRTAHAAVNRVAEAVVRGKTQVIDVDLKAYFDNVGHDILLSKVAKRVDDDDIMRLLKLILKANGKRGVPQGSPLSPLFSNIVLDDLDKELERRGHRFCRYADDCNIYLKSRRAAERTYSSIRKFIEKKLKLKVNISKSAADIVWRRKFLGFSYYTSSKGEISLRLAPGVAKRQRDKIREITKRNRGKSIDSIIAEINVKMIGFINYFKIADMKDFLVKLESWIRRKLRVIVWKHWKKMRTKFRKLLGMGLTLEQTKIIVYSRKKYWRLSMTPQLNTVMGIAFFRDKGLLNLVERYSLIR